jgi:AcrR family transcriptional regulator
VTVALQLVEADGLAAFSTRRLGDALACEAMSIYHHFPSKQHLLDAMVAAVIGGFRWPAAKLDAVERLRRTCYGYRELAHRHPRFFPYVAVHRLNTEAGVRFIERVLTAFEAVVRNRERAARYFRAVGYYLVGAALDETSGYALGPSAAEPVSDAYVAENCPRLLAAAPYFARSEWDKTFALGLDGMIDEMTRK